jgi:hypothetical protein
MRCRYLAPIGISVECGRIACGDPATSLGDEAVAELQSLGAQTGVGRRPFGSVSVARYRLGGPRPQRAGLGRVAARQGGSSKGCLDLGGFGLWWAGVGRYWHF